MATRTRSFGSSGRTGHDATEFYSRRLYEVSESNDTEVNRSATRNVILCKSSERMEELPDSSVALVVTSPPYNVGKDYDEDLSLEEYAALLKRVFVECYRVLEPGGRACINIANVGRRPYIPLSHMVGGVMQDIGYLMRGEIIWKKASGASGSCAWGSFKSASNPTLRDIHEYILVYCKGRFDRILKGEDTITKDSFMRDTLSVWEFPPASASKVGHPAPFPVELPSRFIQLYTFKGDLILDPFAGAGTTCCAAKIAGRDYIGYELNQEYVQIAQQRIHLLI